MLIRPKTYLRILSATVALGLATACTEVKPADEPPPDPFDPSDPSEPGEPSDDTLADLLAKAKNYNILFITSDEHNAQMTGYERTLGFITDINTPNLDKLAGEGAYFTHAYAACPLCAPTRASIMTSLYPLEHGLFNHNAALAAQSTWGNFFTDQGYYTGIIGKTHDNSASKLGFQYAVKQSGENSRDPLITPSGSGSATTVPAADKPFYDAAAALTGDGSFRGGILADVLRDQDGLVTELVKKFLTDNKNKKFFLHASLIAPHWPWNSPASFYNMYDPATIQMPESLGPPPASDLQPTNVYNNNEWSKITPEMHRVFRARYMGALSWMDDNVGQILKKLEELGLKDKTIVIYSSDHGDMAGEKGMWFKMVMYEQSVRVPLIISAPGIIKPGTVKNTLINHVDYFPTIAGLSGNGDNLPKNISGGDFAAAVLGFSAGPNYTFAVRSTPDANTTTIPNVHMVRSDQYKLVRYNQNNFVMYDIKNDRYEKNNIINTAPASVVNAHKNALTEFMTKIDTRRYPKMLGTY